MAPNFSYLFDRSATEGQEYDVDPRQIRDDRQRRVEQITTEFPSLKEDAVFSYYEQQGMEQEDNVINPEESPGYFSTQQDGDAYHTIPIFQNSGNPLSLQSQEDPDLADVLAIEESEEEEQLDWGDAVAEENGDSFFGTDPFLAQTDDHIDTEGEGPLPLYDRPETPGEGEEDDGNDSRFAERLTEPYEQSAEEWHQEEIISTGEYGDTFDPAVAAVFASDGTAYDEGDPGWTEPLMTEPEPVPVPDSAPDPVEAQPHPAYQSAVSPSGQGFIMPSLDDDDDQDGFDPDNGTDNAIYSYSQEPQPSVDAQAFPVPVQEPLPVNAAMPPEEEPLPVNVAMPPEEEPLPVNASRPPEEELFLPDTEMPVSEDNPMSGELPDDGQAPSFLRESPELVTFSSLEEDPRRNQPRISLLDGLTRYLNDDNADVSPVFYADDDFNDLDRNEMPQDGGEDENGSSAAVSGEEQNQPPLPSGLLFANVSRRPKSQEEFNALKAHVFHSDLGFRKYHITIANLFDVISIERKLYVKYHPRHNRGTMAAHNTSSASTPGNTGGEKREFRADEPAKTQAKNRTNGPRPKGGTKTLFQAAATASGAEEGVEFERPEDVSKIRTELRRDIRFAQKSFYGTGLLALFSLFFTAAETLGIPLPDFMRVSAGTTVFLIVNLLLLIGAILLNFDMIVESVRRLMSLEFDSDSAVSLATILCLIQNLSLLAGVQQVAEGALPLYSGVACLGLTLQAGGKLLMHKRVMNNFRFVASNNPKKAVRLISNLEYSRQVAGESVQEEPIVAYQSRTQFLSGFMRLSYAIDPGERIAQTLTPILLLAGVVIGLLAGIVQGSVLAGFTAAAAAVCASMPAVCMLAINAPMYWMSKSLLRDGVLLTSSASVDEYSEVNNVILDASELFPSDSVILHGVKKFGDQTVEEVMMEAAAVVCAVDGPLGNMFTKNMGDAVNLNLVQGRVTYTDRLGFSGLMEGQPVFVGTADWIRRQGIALPTRDMTQKHMAKGRQILYFAKGDRLVAFFALSHIPDPTIVRAIARYQLTPGNTLTVRSTDPFVTERALSEWFNLGNRGVRVLSGEQGAHYHDIMESGEQRSPAFLATTGRTASFLQSINACIRAKLSFTLIVALQTVAMVLGAAIVALFSLFASVSILSVAAVLVFLLFWLGVVLILPLIRRI